MLTDTGRLFQAAAAAAAATAAATGMLPQPRGERAGRIGRILGDRSSQSPLGIVPALPGEATLASLARSPGAAICRPALDLAEDIPSSDSSSD